MNKKWYLLFDVLKAGFVVGLLDATAAIAHAYFFDGVGPEIIFRYIASGVFGSKAYNNQHYVGWGIVFHFMIAIGWTFLFYIIYPRLKTIVTTNIFSGMIYGITIWLVMNFMVLPLSKVGLPSFDFLPTFFMILIHVFIIGVPIFYFAQRFYVQREQVRNR